MQSILRNLLEKNGCSFEKYLIKINYIKSKDDIRETLYLTPVVTPQNNKLLFITREIKGNWFDSVKDIGDICSFVSNNYNYSPADFSYFYHIYIENIKFEQFYKVDDSGDFKLSKLTISDLQKFLK
jgi:hypothetical protein